MDTVILATASTFDPEAITPVHVIAAVAANLAWLALVIADRRRLVRERRRVRIPSEPDPRAPYRS